MKPRCYLDYNATAPLRPEARQAMLAAMDLIGNPSSVHAEGRAARMCVENAREAVARAVGCKPKEVVFTGGATEAARVLGDPIWGHVEVEGTAHDCLFAYQGRGAGNGPSIYAMGGANGETGIIADLPERGEEGRWSLPDGGTADHFLIDVVQMIGREPFSFAWSGADLAILSAHKLGGPKGVGALIVKEGLEIASLADGGGQEMGRRSGTENVVGIAGFGAAITAAMADYDAGVWAEIEKLRMILEKLIAEQTKETIFVGNSFRRLGNTSSFITPGWKGETQVMQMDLAGFAISAGSACSSGKVKASRVLQHMGFGQDGAASAVRVSLGPATTRQDIDAFAVSWGAAWNRHKARRA